MQDCPSGVNLNVNLSYDSPFGNGNIYVYKLENVDGVVNEIPIGEYPATQKELAFTIPDADIAPGTSSYKVKYVSDTLTVDDCETTIVYNKNALSVTITPTGDYDATSQTMNLECNVSTENGKSPLGMLKLYYIDKEGNARFIQQQEMTTTNSVMNTSIGIDSEFVSSGDNVYKYVFETSDANTFNNAETQIVKSMTGSEVTVSGEIQQHNGSGTIVGNISDTTALDYGNFNIYLGQNKLGLLLNKNNELQATINPEQLKLGKNYITFSYETDSARYVPTTETIEFDYTAEETQLALNLNYNEDNTAVNIDTGIINDDLSKFNGTLTLYLGDGITGQKIADSTTGRIQTAINISNLHFGDNNFYVEYVPNDWNTSYKNMTNSILLEGKEVQVMGAVTDRGDRVGISAKVVCEGTELDPADIKIYQGSSNFGTPLTVTIENGMAIAECPKTQMFVGTNLFYVEYIPSDNQYSPADKTLTFKMAADGSPLTDEDGNPWTPERIQELITAITEIGEDWNISIERLITILNANFELLDGDLKSLKEQLEALVNKEYPEIPNYNDKLDSLIQAISDLSANMNNDSTVDLTTMETILQAIQEKMPPTEEGNNYYTAVTEALKELEQLKEIKSSLDSIKDAITNGTAEDSVIGSQLKEIAQQIAALNSKVFVNDLGNIETQLTNIVTALGHLDNSEDILSMKESLAGINAILNTINDSIKNNKVDLSEMIAAIESLKQALIDSRVDISDVVSAIGDIKNTLEANGTADLSTLEDLLQKLVDATKDNKQTVDFSNLESLIQDLIAATSANDIDTSKIEDYLKQLAENSSNNTAADLSTLESLMQDLIDATTNNTTDISDIVNSLQDLIQTAKDNNANTEKFEKYLEQIAANNVDLSGIEKLLADMILALQDNAENSKLDLSDLLSKLDALIEASKNNNIDLDTSNIEDSLKDLIKIIKESNNSEIDTSKLEECLKELTEAQNLTLEDIEKKLQDLIESTDKIVEAIKENKVDLSGIENALNYIADKEDKTEEVVKSINNLKDAVVNNDNKTMDTTGIEKQLEQLVEETKTDKIVFDTSSLEKALKDLKESNNGIETEQLDRLFKGLQDVLAQNQSEISGLQNSVSQLIDQMRQSTSNSVDPVELLTALNRISLMLDNANKKGVDKETMEGILTSLNNIDSALRNNTLKSEDLNKIILAIEGLKIEMPEPDIDFKNKFDIMSSSIEKIAENTNNLPTRDDVSNISKSILKAAAIVAISIAASALGIIAAICKKNKKVAEREDRITEILERLTYSQDEEDTENNNDQN